MLYPTELRGLISSQITGQADTDTVMVDHIGLALAFLFPAGHEDWLTVYQGLQFGGVIGKGELSR